MGASSFTYVEATGTQTLGDWIVTHTHAFAEMPIWQGAQHLNNVVGPERARLFHARRLEPRSRPGINVTACVFMSSRCCCRHDPMLQRHGSDRSTSVD